MKLNVWNFWANKYNKLWVQKYSLKPTRKYIINSISQNKFNGDIHLLDLGCGPGELIEELSNKFENFHITGLDFSEKMLEISKQRNKNAKHILMNVDELDKLNEANKKFRIIICTHSLPYYKNSFKVLKDLYELLEDEGRVFIAFASGNNFYDKLALSFVKLTTGSANYPSDKEFRQIIDNLFEIEHLNTIKEKIYMPRIAVYTLKKVLK